jgi:hypothetical protein
VIIRAGHFLQEFLDVDDAEIVGAVSAQPDDAEIRIAHHHRVGRAPLVAGEQARDDVIDIGLERALQRVLPALEVGQDRDVVCRQRILARAERVAELAQDTNCAACDSRTMSCAPFLISLSSSGKRYDNVSRESSSIR